MHKSVMTKEMLKALDVQPDDTVVDATLGGAGHFKALLAKLGGGGVIVGIDADLAAVERGREAYATDRRPERPVAHLVNDNFRNLARILERLSVRPPTSSTVLQKSRSPTSSSRTARNASHVALHVRLWRRARKNAFSRPKSLFPQ